MKKLISLTVLVIASVFLIPSCKKKNDPAPATAPPTTPTNPGPTGITAKFYFQATIDGTVVTFQDAISGYGSGAGNESGSVLSGWQEVQSGILAAPFSANTAGGFAIMKTFPAQPSTMEVDNMFKVKSYSYGKVSNNTGADGVDGAVVMYIDNSGVEWRSDAGSGAQSGSTFSVTENIANTDGYSAMITRATFSCKLYNSSGASKTLTNGFCRSRTVSY